MIGQALADARAVDDRGDPDAAQMVGRTDARQLQAGVACRRRRAHDDFLVGEGLLDTSAAPVFDADGATVADDHPADLGFGDDRQIVAGLEVAARRAPALAVVDGDGSDRCTVEFGSADIVVGADTCRTRRRDESLQTVRRDTAFDQFASAPAQSARTPVPRPATTSRAAASRRSRDRCP